MKKTDYGLELETTEEVEAFVNAVEASMNASKNVLILVDSDLYKKTISPNKIYFLSHPCTSGRRSIEYNRKHEEEMYQFILSICPEAKVIRPLKIIPNNYDYDDAMRVCYSLMDLSDEAIFCPEFQTSRGCIAEHKNSFEINIPRLYIVSEDVSEIANLV